MATHSLTLTLKPHWSQYIINELPALLLELACLAGYWLVDSEINTLCLYAALAIMPYLIYCAVYQRSIEYVVTGEQLIFRHGVISHATEYMELYRVVDYQQRRSLIEQIFGLKTVIIISGDRTMPVLAIKGVKNGEDVISEIRMRVEYNKTRKGVYEITNRY